MDAASKALARGTELDDGSIVIGEKIGQGGFGITYLAYDRRKRKNIVLKEFYPDHMVSRQTDNSLRVAPDHRLSYEKSLRGFIREARVLNALKHHPNIVRVFFFLEENNTAYYGMEQLHGMDLRHYAEDQRRKTGKPMDAVTAYRILKPIMKALEYSHANKVLHRDISPDNIFMDEVRDDKGNVQIVPKLIDFGAAYVAIEDFTHTYPNVRKNGYSPFEQTMPAEHQGSWCDVYALSATFYALIVGRPPVSALDRANSEKLIPPIEAGAVINEAANSVLMEGLAFMHRDRIQSIAEFERRMGNALNELTEDTLTKRESRAQTTRGKTVHPQSVVTSTPSEISGITTDRERSSRTGQRAAAYLIDLLLFGAISMLLQFVLDQAMGYSVSAVEFVMLTCIWLFVLMFGCGTALSVMPMQATPGMMLMGLRLHAQEAGGEVSVSSCVLFHIMRSVPLLSLAAELIPVGEKPSLSESVSGLCVAAEKPQQIDDMSEVHSGVVTHTGTAVDKRPSAHTGGSNTAPRQVAAIQCVKGDNKATTILHNGICVGRGVTGKDIRLPQSNAAASGKHCTFVFEGGQWYVKDHSTNGTLVNGKKLSQARSCALKPGMRIEIGSQQFVFVMAEEPRA